MEILVPENQQQSPVGHGETQPDKVESQLFHYHSGSAEDSRPGWSSYGKDRSRHRDERKHRRERRSRSCDRPAQSFSREVGLPDAVKVENVEERLQRDDFVEREEVDRKAERRLESGSYGKSRKRSRSSPGSGSSDERARKHKKSKHKKKHSKKHKRKD